MKGLRNIFTRAGEALSNRWTLFAITSLLLLGFIVWTGWWWLVIGEALVYDYFISKRIKQWNQEACRRSRVYRTVYAVWCAAIFALVFGTIAHILLSRWSTPYLLTLVPFFAYGLWYELKGRNTLYRKLYEWVHAIVFAVIVASLIHKFIFQMYVIPTGSMESTLMAGDYIMVSKIDYGPQLPRTPLEFPFVHNTMPMSETKPSFSRCVQRPYRRLAGTDRIERNDIVVFNFPEGDTVVMEFKETSYYDILRQTADEMRQDDICRGITRRNADYNRQAREYLNDRFTIVTRPVDKKENYIKRCVALPGDTLRIVGGDVTIDSQPQAFIPHKQYDYMVYAPNSTRPQHRIIEDCMLDEARGGGAQVERRLQYQETFPHAAGYGWTTDDFGGEEGFWIPAAGATIALTTGNLPLYRRAIEVYEGHRVETDGDKVIIDGEAADSYTFAMNYYFMMGDNRHYSADSRYFGLVPEDHIVGKAAYVWLSIEPQNPANPKSLFERIRWKRMFKSII